MSEFTAIREALVTIRRALPSVLVSSQVREEVYEIIYRVELLSYAEDGLWTEKELRRLVDDVTALAERFSALVKGTD